MRQCVVGPVAGELLQPYVRDHCNGVLHRLGVEQYPYLRFYGAYAGTAYFQHTVNGESVLLSEVDTVVVANPQIPDVQLERALSDWEGELHAVGDCLAPRTAEEAILEGFEVAMGL